MSETLDKLPTIALDSLTLGNSNDGPKNSSFNVKNYLDTRVPAGEKEKSVTIRLLPIDLTTGNPFVLVHTHNVQVAPGMVKAGEKPYKTYICLKKNADIDHDKFGHKCPFCELNWEAYKEKEKATDPTEKEFYKKLSLANISREALIGRVVERGNENEGVKFWRFNLRNDNTDPFHQIQKLAGLRLEQAQKKGKYENILDIYSGRDLTVTFSSEGTAAPTIVDDSELTPLSNNEEQMRAWIYDSKKWQDVFTCKPYEYLSLVAQMKVPWFDRTTQTWIDKEVYDGKVKESNGENYNAIKNAEAHIREMESAGANKTEVKEDFTQSLMMSDDAGDDDLPF